MQLTPDIVTGSIAALLGSALYAFSVVVYRSQKESIRPVAISSIKMWVALGFMSLMMLLPFVESPFAVPFLQFWLLSVSVVLGAVIGDTIYLISQERIGVSYAFPISMSFPVLTYTLTIVFLGDSLIISRFLGIIIAVVGIAILSQEQESEQDQEGSRKVRDILGIGLAVMSSVLYAVGTVVLQVGVADVDPITANFIRVAVGSVAFVPVMGFVFAQGMPLPPRRATKYVAIAALFGMAIGSLLYVTAVKFAGAAITAVLSSTAPLFAVPISVLLLKERMTRPAAIGTIATIIGVVLVIVGI
jgi:drug/metabolite transporter (DMT)-like permease